MRFMYNYFSIEIILQVLKCFIKMHCLIWYNKRLFIQESVNTGKHPNNRNVLKGFFKNWPFESFTSYGNWRCFAVMCDVGWWSERVAWQRMPVTTVTVAQCQLAGVLLRMQRIITMTYVVLLVISHLRQWSVIYMCLEGNSCFKVSLFSIIWSFGVKISKF